MTMKKERRVEHRIEKRKDYYLFGFLLIMNALILTFVYGLYFYFFPDGSRSMAFLTIVFVFAQFIGGRKAYIYDYEIVVHEIVESKKR